MRIFFGVFILSFLSGIRVFAADFPFVDVPLGNTYYPFVETLYKEKIISDDGSHKFKPDEPLTRDMFYGIVYGSSCESCLSPSIDDFTKSQSFSSVDLKEDNPYFYCIVRAKEENLIDNITLGQDGKYSCENNDSFSEAPFCANNSVSRLTAVITLLKKAKLWNDTLNNSFQSTINITDVPDNLKGYAEKAVKLDMLTVNSEGKIDPYGEISKGEFAKMAAKIFLFNQCVPPGSQNTVRSNIIIKGTDGDIIKKSLFGQESVFTLEGLTPDNDQYDFRWRAYEKEKGTLVAQAGNTFPSSKLNAGNWIIELSVLDKVSKEKVSQSLLTLSISLVKTQNLPNVVEPPSAYLIAAPNSLNVGGSIDLSSNTSGKEPLSLVWNFGDGNIAKTTIDSSSKIDGSQVSHIYSNPGTYTLSVFLKDNDGKVAFSRTVVEVIGKNDKDSDGVEDSIDACPLLQGDDTSKGCPSFKTNIYTQGALLSNSNVSNDSIIFALDSSTTNSNITVATSTTGSDADNDGIEDSLDSCPTTPGSSSNGGCPLAGSFLGNIEQNSCIMDEIQKTGGIIVEPICESCPCPTSVSMGASLRRCDIIFPAILSKDLLSIYSRGPLFQIP